MGNFNDFQKFLAVDKTKEAGKQVTELAIKALLGDFESLKDLCVMIKQGPAFYKNIVFIEKLKAVLCGVCECEEDIVCLAEALANGNERENAERVLDCIDAIDTMSKVKYIVNATRSYMRFLRGFTGLNKREYYRCIYIIKNILLEDIEFLIEKLRLKEVIDSDSCVALDNLGLMYITKSNEDVYYAFSELAYTFYDEVIVGDNEQFDKIPKPETLPQKMDIGPEFLDL